MKITAKKVWSAGRERVVLVRALGGVAVSAGCASLALVACTQQKAGEGHPPEAGTSAAQAAALPPPSASVAAPAAAEPEDFRVAMRIGDWAEAARILDALPAADKDAPSARFARAYAASELGQHAVCVERLAQLESKLPLLSTEIQDARAHCQLEVGPFAAAAAYFGAKDTSVDILRSALAFERDGKPDKALAACQQVIVREVSLRQRAKGKRQASKHPPSLRREADARELRARIYTAQGKAALADAELRWIATQVPDKAPSEAAGAKGLSKQQRYDRAMAFARAGDVGATDAELELLGASPGKAIAESEVVHAKGWARYMARQYKAAAPLLERATELGSEHAVRDYYYAAKSWSRTHDDRRAIKMYERLATRYPSSSFAEHARYNAARLHYILGDWANAERAFKAYLAKHGKRGQHTASAQYELAVTWLAGGKPVEAERALRELHKQAKGRDEASLLQLQGVALYKQGKSVEAAQRFREVIETQPLSFSALAAAARLKQLGQSLPPAIQPPKSAPARAELALSLPPKVQALHDAGLSLEAEAELGRQEATFRKAYEPRADEALCRAYAMLGSAERRYRVGQRAVRWEQLRAAPSSATRWNWECIYPEPFSTAVEREAEKHSLSPGLLYALMRQESSFRPAVVSPANAVGLMQLIPPTARNVASELSVEYKPELLRVPSYNIRFGSYYLKKVLDQFSGSVPLALAAYNAGPSAVGRWLESGHKLPLDLFVARIPYGETRGYVDRVLGNLARYAYLNGGEAAIPELNLELPSGVQVPEDAY